ncbi:MAG: tetratricopeptide repeat protein [Phycisphaerae bacterium]|nr:tetratricopeptide repeat protein [Phycisphaerae bacterium]
MAKRLNKKIAIIGSLILALLIVVAIVVILNLSRDPQKYIADAEAALALPKPDYEAAAKAYGRAFGYAKNTELKIDILFRLAKIYIDTNEWPKAAGCWDRVIGYDTKNLKARLALLDYRYQLATAGNWTVWKDVESGASELISKELDKSPRMYRIRGQALVELIKRGQVTDKETAIKDAIEILRKTSQDEPNNADTYQYLADAIKQQGEILAAKGVLGAADNARQEAVKVLTKGIENIPDDPKTYINLCSTKLDEAKKNPDKYKELETELTELTKKFNNSALPYFGMVQLYQTTPKDIDKAVAAVKKAIEFDKQNVSYAVAAANLYYRKFAIDGNEDDFQKAIDIAKEALSFPDSLDTPGPKARVNFINRYALRTFLADCFVEKAVDAPDGQPEKSKWIQDAESEIYQIDQLLGSAENPYVIMWQGRLLFAKGQVNDAIAKMNTAYEILTASGQAQGDFQLGKLSYALARALRNSPEAGAIIQFYSTAVRNGLYYSKPEMLLDFASVLMATKDWRGVLDATNFYETNFGKNEKSNILRINAYIGAGMFEQAQELLDKLGQDNLDTIKLRMSFLNNKLTRMSLELERGTPGQQSQVPPKSKEQLKMEYDTLVKEQDRLRDKLASSKMADLREDEVVDICKKYVAEEQTGKAQKLIGNFLQEYPNSISAKVYQIILAEPQPANVPAERFEQLTVKTIESLNEPVKRASLLGQFYQNRDQKDKAVEYYQQVLQLEPNNSLAIAGLFDIAVDNQNYEEAEKLAETARQNNTDLCEGEFFKARLAFARKEYQKTIERVNNCLEKRPIFSKAYLLRGQANAALEKESDALSDVKKAYSLNISDGMITRNLAYLLYNRNRKLGASTSVDQAAELKTALVEAMRTNPMDFRLKSVYAEYISNEEPEKAIAACQQIQKFRPSIENSLILGRLAMEMAAKNKMQTNEKLYFSLAEDAYKKAYELAPDDRRVLGAYSEFFVITGKPGEAEKLLADHNDLLWRFYVRAGKLDEAQQLLTQLWEANPKDVNTIKGLILVSRTKRDQAGILKYTAELLKVDNSMDNQIIEIESYLEAGLVDGAQTKLDSLCERFPDEPRTMFLKTWFLARRGKLDEALKLANKNLAVEEDNPRTWRLRGQINLALGNLNQAIDDLQKSRALQENSEIRVDLAKAYIRAGREEEAVSELRAAVDAQGSAVNMNMLEEAYLITGKTDRLEKFYLEIIEKFPDNTYWYNRAGELAMNQKQFDKAFTLFDKAFQNSLKINSESPDSQAFEGKLRALLEAKKYDQLFAEATKYLEGPMAVVAYAKMADAKAQMGDKGTAIQYFRRALEKTGSNENYIINILRYMNQVVGSEETMKWCSEKLQSQPDSLAINLAMFNLYKIAGEYNKALEYVNNCIRIAGDNKELKLASQNNKAGILYEAFSKTSDKTYLEQAIKEYESILQEQPTDTTVLNNLAYMLIETNMDAAKALQYAEKAYKTASNNPGILDTYGYVLLKNGKLEQADEFLQRSVQQFEQNKMNAPIEVYEHIGLTKEKLGQNAEALKAYKRAMELAGKDASKEVKDRISAGIERVSPKE